MKAAVHRIALPSPVRLAIIDADKSKDKTPIISVLLNPTIQKTDSDHRDLADWIARSVNPGRKPWPPLYEHEARIAARNFFDELPRSAPKAERIEAAAAAFGLPISTMRSVAAGSLESLKNYRGTIPPDSLDSPRIVRSGAASDIQDEDN